MKRIPSLVLSAVLLWGVSSARAQEPEAAAVPGEVATSMGSSVAAMCYLTQALYGRLFDADVSTEETRKSTLMAAGGAKGGLNGARKDLVETLQFFTGEDAESLKSLIHCMELQDSQASALIEHLKAKAEGTTNEIAVAEYRSKRAAASQSLVKFGFPLEMVE